MILLFCNPGEQKNSRASTLNKTEIPTALSFVFIISHQTVQTQYDVPHICKQDG